MKTNTYTKFTSEDNNIKYTNIRIYVLIGLNINFEGSSIDIPDIYLVPKSMFQKNEKYWLEELKYTTLYDEIELPGEMEYNCRGYLRSDVMYEDKILIIGWRNDNYYDSRVIKQKFIIDNNQIAWSIFHAGECKLTYLNSFSKNVVKAYTELYNKLRTKQQEDYLYSIIGKKSPTSK